MFIPTEKVVRRVLMLLIAGTKGGPSRLKILFMLQARPLNINEISMELSVDYKTAQHHVRVLEKHGLIISSGKSYGNSYSISPILESSRSVLKSMIEDMGKSK